MVEPKPPMGVVSVLLKTDAEDEELELNPVGLDPNSPPLDGVCAVEPKFKKLGEPEFCRPGSSLIAAGLCSVNMNCGLAFDSVVEPRPKVLATLAD